MMTLVVAVFAAAALGAVVAWNLRPAAAPPPVTRTLLKLSDDEGQLSQLGRQMIAISPDGTRIAHTANQRLWLRSVSDFDSRAIASGTIGIHSPAFSPDGQSVAFYSGNAMKRVSVIGDAPVTLCAVDAPFGVAWDASGIIVGQGAKGIVRCAPSGGPAEQLATVQRDEQAHGPQMLPDGQHLLFAIAKTDSSADGGVAARWDRAQIVIQDLKSGQRNTVINGGSNGRYVASGHLLYTIGGVVLAVPFDLRTLATSGIAAPVLEGVSRARTNATGAAHMAVSSGGTLLYVPGPVSPSSNLRQLTLADRAGVVTPLKLPAGPYTHVRASRDGKRLALGSDDGMEAIVWIYDLAETSAVRRLTLDGKNRFPIWSPDGERVAFQSDREGDLAIFTQRVDGTGSIERLTKPDKGEAHVPGSWAPDGKSLAFTVSKEPSLELWTVSLADKKMAPYGHVVSAEAIEPTFSPDGRWIAYSAAPPSTGVSPNRGVYVQPVPASGARYQAPKQQLDFQPVWSPDGHELFYVPSAASGRIAAARVSTQSGVTFGAPEILPARVTAARTSNEPRAFDILPDGRFIGLIGSGSDSLAAIELRLVLNWFEELKQRAPVK